MINPLLLSGGEVTPPEPPYIIERSNIQGGAFYQFNRTRNNTEACYWIWENSSTVGATKGTIAFWIKDELNGLVGNTNNTFRVVLGCENVPDNLAQKPFILASSARGDRSSANLKNDQYYFTPDDSNLIMIGATAVAQNGWAHWVIAYDTTQAVAADRLSIYINGVEMTLGNLDNVTLPQNKVMGFFQQNYRLVFSHQQQPVADPTGSYVADVYAIPGMKYGPEKFGKFSGGVWVPIEWPDAIPTESGAFFAEFKEADTLNPNWTAATGGGVDPRDFGSSLGTGNYIGELSGEDTNFGYRAFNGLLTASEYSISNDVSPGGTLTWTTSQVGPNDQVEWLVGPAGGNAAAAGETGSISGTNLTTVNLVSDGSVNSPQWYTIRAANTGLAFTDATLTHDARRDMFGLWAIKVNGEVLVDFSFGFISYTNQSPTEGTNAARGLLTDGPPGRYASFPAQLGNKRAHGFGPIGGYSSSALVTNPTGWCNRKSDIHVTSGKWAFQVTSDDDTLCSNYAVGLVEKHWGGQDDPVALGSSGPENFMWELSAGTIWVNGSSVATVSMTSGDVGTVLYDAATGDIRIYVGATLQYTGTGALNSAYGYCIHHGQRGTPTTAGSVRVNTGERPWMEFNPETLSYKPWFFQDILPTLPSVNPATAHSYAPYTATGSSLAVSTSCDADWFKVSKQYSTTTPTVREDHIHDELRGLAALPKGTGAETTIAQGVTSVSAGTVNIGTDLDYNENANGNVYAVAAWSAPNSSTNTDGTVTSSLLTNVSTGFSIATWTNTGGSYTIGHGLTEAPKLIIVRNRASNNWIIGGLMDNHRFTDMDWTQAIDANGSSSWAANNIFNDTAPTSSVITFNGGNAAMGTNMVAYIFHEVDGISNFGRFLTTWDSLEATGEQMYFGGAYCGFRPQTILGGGQSKLVWSHDDNSSFMSGVTTTTGGTYVTFPEPFATQTNIVEGTISQPHSLMPVKYGFVGKGFSLSQAGLGAPGWHSYWAWAKEGNISSMMDIHNQNGRF